MGLELGQHVASSILLPSSTSMICLRIGTGITRWTRSSNVVLVVDRNDDRQHDIVRNGIDPELPADAVSQAVANDSYHG